MKTSILKFKGKDRNGKLQNIAEKFCKHEFNILGSGWRNVRYGMTCPGFEGKNYSVATAPVVPEETIPEFYREKHATLTGLIQKFVPGYEYIDWQIDFKSGARFDAGTHHSKLQYGVVEGVDAKVSADLGRLYQLPVLAKAYRATGNRKYKNEALAQLLDFMAFNPCEYGAAWRANMNVSIRAANIIASIDILEYENPDEELRGEIRENLAAHGNYIFENLEFPEEHFHPNHFIANLAGLLMTACAVKESCAQSGKWHDYALDMLKKQIISQSYPDGVNFEGATTYHCLVLEMITDALIYAARSDGAESPGNIREWFMKSLDPEAVDRLRKNFQAARDIIQPDGLVPVVGDNDSGRFLYLEGLELDKRDYRFLPVIGAWLFENESLLTSHDSRHIEYAEIITGQKINFSDTPRILQSAAYPDAGYFIMRDHEDGYAFINCGPIGTDGKGGHSHNDKLALTLQLKGNDIFVDPGIYTYTASGYFRNLYRSVKAHNTLCLDGREQNTWGIDNPWWGLREESKCECLKWESSKDEDIFAGNHHAYEKLDCAAIHQRTVQWNKKKREIQIVDKLSGKKDIPASECGFILAPECLITRFNGKNIHLQNGTVQLEVSAENGEWKTEPAFYSPGYGMKIYTQRLVLKLPDGIVTNKTTIGY